MDETEPKESNVGGGSPTPPPPPGLTLEKAIDLGEYDEGFLAQI